MLEVSFTVAAEAAAAATPAGDALTAAFQHVPESHDGPGAGDFTFRVLFSEDVATGYEVLRDQSFEVAGGTVKNPMTSTSSGSGCVSTWRQPGGGGRSGVTGAVGEKRAPDPGHDLSWYGVARNLATAFAVTGSHGASAISVAGISSAAWSG